MKKFNLKHIQKYKSLLESFFSLSILNGINAILPLVTLPYILRVVGVANYGVYAYVYVIIQYVLLMTSYGFNYSATKQISQNRDDLEKINVIYNNVIYARLILFGISILLLALLSPLLFENKVSLVMTFLGLGVVLGDIFSPIWLFQGLEKMRYFTITNVVAKVLFTLLIFIFIQSPDDYVYIILFNSLGYLISGIIGIIIANRLFNVRLSSPSLQQIIIQYREGCTMFVSTIGMNLYRNANIFILKFFVDDTFLGIYAASEKLIKGLQSLTTPISQAFFPHFGHVFKQNSIKQNLLRLKQITLSLAVVFFILFIGTFVASPLLVAFLYGSKDLTAILIVRIMSPVLLFGGINYILGIVGLVNLDQQKKFSAGVIISGITGIVFLFITISYWTIYAAAWSMLLSELVLFVICLISIMSYSKRIQE